MQPAEVCLQVSPGNMNQGLFGEHVHSSVKHSTRTGAAEPRQLRVESVPDCPQGHSVGQKTKPPGQAWDKQLRLGDLRDRSPPWPQGAL